MHLVFFSLSYAQGLWKPAFALWSFNIVLLVWKIKTPGLAWCKLNPCMFKPNRNRLKIQNSLFWILKIMYWVCVRRLWQRREGQGWLLWGRKKKSPQLCSGSDQGMVNACSSWEAALKVILYYLTSLPRWKNGDSEEKAFLPDEQAWHWSGCTSILHVKSFSKKHLSCQYCCCYCSFSYLMAVPSKLLSS